MYHTLGVFGDGGPWQSRMRGSAPPRSASSGNAGDRDQPRKPSSGRIAWMADYDVGKHAGSVLGSFLPPDGVARRDGLLELFPTGSMRGSPKEGPRWIGRVEKTTAPLLWRCRPDRSAAECGDEMAQLKQIVKAAARPRADVGFRARAHTATMTLVPVIPLGRYQRAIAVREAGQREPAVATWLHGQGQGRSFGPAVHWAVARRADRAAPRHQPGTDDRRADPIPAGMGGLLRFEPVARVAIAGRLDPPGPALRRPGPVEDARSALPRTPSSQCLRAVGQRGRLQPKGTAATELLGNFSWRNWWMLNPPNRQGTDPHARWCGRGGIARCPLYLV
jgi:hypothetical protein